MKAGMLRCCAAIAILLACRHSTEDRIERVEPANYRGPSLPSITLAKGGITGALVGAVYDCQGQPLTALLVNARRVANDADTLADVVDSTFVLSPLTPGDWQLHFRRIGYKTRLVPVTIQSGRVDTLMVQLSESPLQPIGDCVCANGRDFGGQCCKPKPVTIHVCTPRERRLWE